jgi:hypothetical protein
MSELRSAIDGVDALALTDLPDARLEEEFSEVRAARERLEVIELRMLAQLERRQVYARNGYLSAVSWLATTQRASRGSAQAQVATARALDQMPITLSALQSGDVSMSAAKMLISARETDPVAFFRSESLLVDAARRHDIGDLRRVLAYWRQRVEIEAGASSEDRLRERRNLHASVTLAGMVRVDGDLDPETGEAFLTALGAVMDAESRGRAGEDVRSAVQRRCDALGELSRWFLDKGDRPSVAGERPHLTVTVDASVLGGSRPSSPTRPCELDHVGPVPPETALRLACDSSVMRVVMSADSQPLDVGRRTPVVPVTMRRAVIVRDRTCRFPGCDRPHTWCDAHHVVHWARGGPTATSNLLLLCRRHHRLVHHGFGLRMTNGRPEFTRPDGSPLLSPLDGSRGRSRRVEGRAPP